jgi:hypothetical protein
MGKVKEFLTGYVEEIERTIKEKYPDAKVNYNFNTFGVYVCANSKKVHYSLASALKNYENSGRVALEILYVLGR